METMNNQEINQNKDLKEEMVCKKCGNKLDPEMPFCPKCGTKIKNGDKNNKKIFLLITILLVVVVLIVLFAFVFKQVKIDKLDIKKDALSLRLDDTADVEYDIIPSEKKDIKIKWTSSNESVATVNEYGTIITVGEGDCVIRAEAGGQFDEVVIKVKKGPDFKKIYEDLCSEKWAKVGDDGSYLAIDTNPKDKDDYVDFDAFLAISDINEALNLPEYIYEDMGTTTAIMGKQSETFTDLGLTVSWKYHPDNGLEVNYKLINE